MASEVLVLDGISLWDFDYIDLGRVRMPSFTVPVTIKSLVFSEDPRIPHTITGIITTTGTTITTTTTSRAARPSRDSLTGYALRPPSTGSGS